MATPRQTDLFMRLLTRQGKIKSACAKRYGVTEQQIPAEILTEFTDAVRAQFEALTAREADTAIKKANANNGWDRNVAPASPAQRLFIADLEKKAYGRRKTMPSVELNYSDADAMIRDLKDYIASQKPRLATVTYLRAVK